MFTNLIPISMVVTIEVVWFLQSAIIGKEEKLYYWRIHEHNLVNASNMIDELGLVKYIFSDKTGTLTSNKL